MPELPVPPLRTVACSEPVWIGGAIYTALEFPDRSAISVWLSPATQPGVVATLMGAPTQDASEGPRAMWPRMAELAPGWQCVYQRGTRNAWVDDSAAPVDIGPAHGIWPVAVRQDTWLGSQAKQATPIDGSQGIFGYLDGQWWSLDRIRQSAYATPYPRGVLFHGWRDKGVLHLLFTEGSATVPDRVILCTDEGGVWNRFLVFEGRAEYPRGCSTPDGVYIHAVGEGGQYRAAIGPFPRLDEVPVPMPKPTIAVLGYTKSGITPATFGFAFSCANAVTVRKIVSAPDGRIDTEDMPAPQSGSGYGEVVRTEVGTHLLTLEAISSDGQTDRTGAIRRLDVLPVPETPRPEPQVITELELDVLAEDLAYVREQATAAGERAYYNARCAGETHAEALSTCRQVIADAVLGQEEES